MTLPIIHRISSSATLTVIEATELPGNGYHTMSVQTETSDKEVLGKADIEPEVLMLLKQIKLESPMFREFLAVTVTR